MDALKKKIIIEVSITAFIIVAFTSGIYFFGGKISAYSDEIKSLHLELATRSGTLNSIAALRSEYNSKVKNYFPVLYNVIPVKDQLINIAKDYQFLAAQSGLNLSFMFMNESAASASSFGSLNFRLTINGDFDKLLAFVPTLQKFRFLSSYQTFSLTRGKEQSQMVTQGQVYYRDPIDTPH